MSPPQNRTPQAQQKPRDQQQPRPRHQIVRHLITQQMSPYAAKLLAKPAAEVERFTRVFLNAMENGDPDLMVCSDGSIARGLLLAAEVNLMPGGPYPWAYLIPYRNKDRNCLELQFQISVWGYTELMRRAGVRKVWADVVHENDPYECISGTAGKQIIHKPNWFLTPEERGKVIGSYACGMLANEEVVFEPTSWGELMQAKAENKGRSPAWDKWPGQQYQKVSLKRLSKYMPKGDPRDHRGLQIDENPNTAPMIEVPGVDVTEGLASSSTVSVPATAQDALGQVVSQARAQAVVNAQNDPRPGLDRDQLYQNLCDADERWKGQRKRFETLNDEEALAAASWLHAVERLQPNDTPPEMPPCLVLEEQQDAADAAFGGRR